ncbi:hypothetical protein KUCAC02_025106 [Chaenocephalus aceratus]|nr:hypothetical protein KUCAC02_025106 [Chaenocephalus aceratus]
MKLRDPVIEFRGAGGALCAKSTTDHRWYKVQGITKTLDSILCCRNRSSGHNMISMDLYNRAVRDLNEHPDSFLDWVPEYVRDLNAPESKGRVTAGAAEAQRVRVPHVGSVQTHVGQEPVAGIPAPDRCSAPGSYTYHNGCMQGCKSIRGTWGFYTEVDLVAHDPVTGKIVLLELKTRNKDVLDQAAMWRYNAQAWQTWMMFLLTYPSMAERSAAYLVIVRPGTNLVPVRSAQLPGSYVCEHESGEQAAPGGAENGLLGGPPLWETARSRIVVLVKDGERAPKPAMRDIRDKRHVVPHIDFCMRNLGAVEYTMMKLMADVVPGLQGTRGQLVSLDVLEDLVPDIEMCDVDGSYVDGCVERPECTDGVFVATFADPESREVSILREACLGCTSTEADTLLVELANVLGGSVTVCSGDSDLVAVLTACGREGITLRMENRSYHEDREMNAGPSYPAGELSSSELRFRALCDVAEEDQGLAHTQREQHVKFENIVAGNEKLGSEEEVARAKRRFSCPGDRVPEVELDEGEEHKALPSEGENPPCSGGEGGSSRMSRIGKAYMQGRVPRGSHGRFLRVETVRASSFSAHQPEVVRDEERAPREALFQGPVRDRLQR